MGNACGFSVPGGGDSVSTLQTLHGALASYAIAVVRLAGIQSRTCSGCQRHAPSFSAWRLHNLLRISQTKLRSRQAKSIPSKGEPAGRTGAPLESDRLRRSRVRRQVGWADNLLAQAPESLRSSVPDAAIFVSADTQTALFAFTFPALMRSLPSGARYST